MCRIYAQKTQIKKRGSQRLTDSVCDSALCSESDDAVVSVRRNSDADILRGTKERMVAPRQSSIVFAQLAGWDGSKWTVQYDRAAFVGRSDPAAEERCCPDGGPVDRGREFSLPVLQQPVLHCGMAWGMDSKYEKLLTG